MEYLSYGNAWREDGGIAARLYPFVQSEARMTWHILDVGQFAVATIPPKIAEIATPLDLATDV